MSVTRAFRSVLMLAAITSVVLAAGCSTAHHPHQPGNPQPPRLFTEHDRANGTTLRVAVGDKIVLVLGSSYWNFAGSSAPGVVRQIGPVRLVHTTQTCVPGGGCQPKRALYKALSRGTAVITAHRLSCGEALRCTGSRGHFRLTVVVR
jgi:hypothetical protein